MEAILKSRVIVEGLNYQATGLTDEQFDIAYWEYVENGELKVWEP